ncbi:MAG: YfcE family phosphodiesterase [Culicoidibacterales bacterium]
MKIVIVSDNHFQKENLLNIFARHSDADYFIHCGDSEFLAKDGLLTEFICVRGNNDGSDFPKEELLVVSGVRILITHGHYQYVVNYGAGNNSGTDQLVKYALQYQADIVCYGHTHIAQTYTKGSVMVINPGSTDFPRGFTNRIPSYAVLTMTKENKEVAFYQAKTHEDITTDILNPKAVQKEGLLSFLKK